MISSSHSVIHRLTPPTCTLEIWGKQSPLSKWTNKEIVKDIHFKLSFDDPTLPEEQRVTISGDRTKLEAIYEGVLVYVEKFLQQSFPIESFPNNKVTQVSDQTSVHVKPKGFISHQLFIQDVENSPIHLSTVQLFDLVTALEEYKTKVATLPSSTNNKSQKIIPLWLRGVAGLVLVVGLTTIGTKLVQKQATESESIASVQEPENQNNQSRFDDIVPPQEPSTETQITPEPKITEPLSSVEKLPPPPAVDTPKPPPNIPDPAKFPIPEGNLVIPPPLPNPIAIKPQIKEKSKSAPNSSQLESRINLSSETAKKSTSSNTPKSNNQSDTDIEINPDLPNNQSQISTNTNSAPTALNNTESEIPPNNQSQISTNTNSAPTAVNNTESKIPQNNQLQEVKAYFKQNWQPPKELKQTIEYRIIINANGSIQRIIPIGKASEIFLDRTNIPLMGEKFVSPLKNQSQATIRLLLGPDGEVTTFLE